MFVIGTAGHVDHGKSTLIKALTGIDPDRLQEERDRGMTIDLGFAWLRLPSGREVSIVDVPGHERFIKNMLAGVGGIDVALLVVAADEGIMPQTEEHLAILDLLQVSRGIVALTKSDLADPEWLDLVADDVRGRLATTSLAGAVVAPVSAVTGAGLPDLAAALDALLAQATPRRDIGRPRLPVDRAFTVAGFGTVVTGTLLDGKLSAGQEVDIVPAGRVGKPLRSRVRGLQTHKKKEETAAPGTRVAVNLANVAVDDVLRGDVLTVPGWLEPSSLMDVRLRMIAGAAQPLEHNAAVTVHSGAAEVEARVSLLQGDALLPGDAAWAQLRLEQPMAALRGDYFIIRSPNATLGGGQIVEPRAQRHRRKHEPTLAALDALARGTPEDLLLQRLGAEPPQELAGLAEKAGLTLADAQNALKALAASGLVLVVGDAGAALNARSIVVAQTGWQALAERTSAILGSYHQQSPLRRGMPQEELKSRLGMAQRLFAAGLARLAGEGVVALEGNLARLPAHEVRFSPQQQAAIGAFFASLAAAPYAPPARAEMEAQLGADVVAALLDQQRLVKVREDVLFGAEAYRTMVDAIIARIKERGRTTVADVRDQFNTSRRYAIAVLEHLDQEHVTRRDGDDRVLDA